jgi:hypothetical protein
MRYVEGSKYHFHRYMGWAFGSIVLPLWPVPFRFHWAVTIALVAATFAFCIWRFNRVFDDFPRFERE